MKTALKFCSLSIALLMLTACHLPSWSTYTNTTYGFELQYPSAGYIVSGATDAAVRIQLPIAPGTTLIEKYLDISVTTGASTCESPAAAGYAPDSLTPVTLTINGLEWVKEGAGEGAAGSYYAWTAYSTVNGSVCVSLTFVLHSANPSVYSTPPLTFDKVGESTVFALIVNTFIWLPASPTAPPPSGWLTYTNLAYGFQLQYPPGGGGLQPGDTAISARIDLPFTAGTNLTEKYLAIDVTTDPAHCASPYGGGPTPVPVTLMINGLLWTKQSAGEGAAGSIFLWTTYSTVSGSVCVNLSFVLHSHPPDLWPTPPPSYDETGETAVFVQIVETFIWLDGAAVTPTFVPTSTPTAASLFFTPHLNAYCRLGPNSSHNSISLAMKGQAYPIDGRNLDNTWFYIMISPQVGCWVPGDAGTPSGDTARVRVLKEIPTPTFTPPPFNCGQFKDLKTCGQHAECIWNRQVTPGVCQNK